MTRPRWERPNDWFDSGQWYRWFPATVKIRRNSDGEVRDYLTWENEGDEDGWSDFIWSEGNYSCDDNRSNFFGDDQDECSDGRYTILSIVDDRNGNLLYSEEQ